MSRLLNASASGSSPAPVGSAQWVVEGAVYDHAAVKFWSCLFDEVAEDFPGADSLRVSGYSDDFLAPEMLDPTALFTAELESLEDDEEMDATIRELAQELDVVGSSPPVVIEVLKEGEAICRREIPEDVIDAELLPVFLVWPLEWGGLSEFGWNRREVSGTFTARDPDRDWRYEVTFSLENRHVKEGLFLRTMLFGVRRVRDG